MRALSLYAALWSASLMSQLSYRTSFWLEIAGRFGITSLELLTVFVLFQHIDALGGWTRPEVVYLYGVASLALGMAELGTDGLKTMPQLVRTGALDRFLVRPAPTLIQALAHEVRPLHLGRIAQGVFAIGLAAATLGGLATPLHVLGIGVSAVLLAAVFAAVFIASAATCVFTVESAEAFNAFTYGGHQLAQYPVSIYRPWLRGIFLYVVPVGFVSYYPALWVLDKPDALGAPAWMPALTPLVAGAFLGAALLFWRWALGRYTSTGS